MSELKIGIIVADKDEYKPFAERVEKGKFKRHTYLARAGHEFVVSTERGSATVYSILCGIGKVNAAVAAAHFQSIGCNCILNFGLSGGVSGVKRGEVVLCNRFLEHDFDLTVMGYKLCEKPRQDYIYESSSALDDLFCKCIAKVKKGTAVSGDRFICDEITRDLLKDNFGAMSCDMETAAIASVCHFAEIPFLALRRISDDAGENATDTYNEMNNKAEALLSDLIFDFIPDIIDSGIF